MDAGSVEESVKNLEHFGGIFNVNQLKNVKIISYPVAFIINSDKHWIAIYLSKTVLEICDSSGYLQNKKLDSKLQKLLRIHMTDKQFFATPRLQNETSANCGLYCICFLFLRLRLKKTLCDYRECVIYLLFNQSSYRFLCLKAF